MHILKKVVVDGFLIGGLIAWLICVNTQWIPFQRGFFCGDESIMYPYKDDTVTIFMLRLVSLALPALIILICEYANLRKQKDEQYGSRVPVWVWGVYSVVISFTMGSFFNELIIETTKNIIGRPRPHFFSVCKPSVNCSLPEWQNRYIQAGDYTCEGENSHLFSDLRKSFLSGHSAIAAYSMIFIALYLQKRMTWQGTRFLRHTLQFLVFMLSWYCSLSRISDFKHHWSDVLAGYALGTILAVFMWQFCTDLTEKKAILTPSKVEVNLKANQLIS